MSRARIIAYRLKRQHLSEPLPASKLVDACAMGIQITAPGTLPTAIGLRLNDFKPSALETALREDRTLVEVTGLRGAGYVIPSHDFSLFTQATFPILEKDLQRLIGPSWPPLKAKRVAASEGIDEVAAVMRKALKGRSLSQDEIHEVWRKKLPKHFLRFCRGCDSFHVPYTLVAAIGLRGDYCFGPIRDGNTAYVLTDEWLGKDANDPDLEIIRRKLVERFLRFFGPATPQGFAKWAGISVAVAKEFWQLVEEDLVEADVEGAPAWLMRKDAAGFNTIAAVKGVHLIPPMDPFLGLPDRESLVPDKKKQALVWRMIGNLGAILVDGELAGVWKAQKRAKSLQFAFEPWTRFTPTQRSRIEEQAARIAGFRECTEVKCAWAK